MGNLIYCANDGFWYGTSAEVAALDVAKVANTTKVYEVDTRMGKVAYKGQWYEL